MVSDDAKGDGAGLAPSEIVALVDVVSDTCSTGALCVSAVFVESVALVAPSRVLSVPGVAQARPGLVATAMPTPNATANAPTRPTCREYHEARIHELPTSLRLPALNATCSA